MTTMHRLGDLNKKQVLSLLHNAHLDFFCDNIEKGLDGKGLKKLQSHADVKAICKHCCRIHRNKLLREVGRWSRVGVQTDEYEDRGRFFAKAIEPVLEVQEIVADLHSRAMEVGRTTKLLASPRARQAQMRRQGIGFDNSDSDFSSDEEDNAKYIDHAPYRYTIQSQLGSGAFAQVSLATRCALPGKDDDNQEGLDIMESESDDEGVDEQQFALKRLSLPMSCLSEEERTEAITEVHVLSTLVHPNILQYEDSFLDSGALHIVMEYAAGGTLEHVIEFYKRESLFIEERMIWSILVQLLQALNYCHAIPIMHRDIKPANVLLSRPITLLKNSQVVTTVMTAITVRRAVSKLKATLRHHSWKKSLQKLQESPKANVRFQTVDALTLSLSPMAADGDESQDAESVHDSPEPSPVNNARNVGLCRVMLGDFGIAKVFDAQVQQTSQQCGTPHYISPELCEGKEYGMEADMWALGVVLYQLMTLRLPFDAPNIVALFKSIIGDQDIIWTGTEEKPSPTALGYSSAMVDVCKALLSQDPADRPMAADLLKRASFAMHIKQWEDVYQKTQWWNFSNDPRKKVSAKKKRQMLIKQLDMLRRAASNLKTEDQIADHTKRINSLMHDVEEDRQLQSAQVYNAIGAVFAEMSDNNGAIHAYEEALAIAVRSIHKNERTGLNNQSSSSLSSSNGSDGFKSPPDSPSNRRLGSGIGLETDVVIDTDRLAQLPGRTTCVKSLSELGTLLVKVAFKNYNVFKANKESQKEVKSPKLLSRRPSRIRRKISLVMDSKLLDDADSDEDADNLMSPETGHIRALISQQRRGLEYLEHANRLEETADRHAQIGSALKRQFIMSDCSDRSLLPRAISAYRRSMEMNRADNAFGCYAMLNILTLEILIHARPVEDLLRDAEATYAEASSLKLQKPGDIWVWVQEGDALVLRYLLNDPTVEIEAVDRSLRGTLTFGASKRIQQSIVDQLYFIRKTMTTLDHERVRNMFAEIRQRALGRMAPGQLDMGSSDEENGDAAATDADLQKVEEAKAVMKQRLEKISQVIAIAESTENGE